MHMLDMGQRGTYRFEIITGSGAQRVRRLGVHAAAEHMRKRVERAIALAVRKWVDA